MTDVRIYLCPVHCRETALCGTHALREAALLPFAAQDGAHQGAIGMGAGAGSPGGEYVYYKSNCVLLLMLISWVVLSIVFQRNVLLLPPTLRLGELDANGEYEQLAEIYSKVVNEGQLNRTQSGEFLI